MRSRDSKKHFSRPDYTRPSLRYDRPKKCPTILYGVYLWMKPSATLVLFSSAKLCPDRLWLLAKFQMRHRLIRGLQQSWHNIIYDALPVKVYIFPELFAPCRPPLQCIYHLFYMIQPRPTNNLDSVSLILIWRCAKIYYPAHVCITSIKCY